MARARTVAGFLVACAGIAAVWFLFLRERGGWVSAPRGRSAPDAQAPALLEGRAVAAGDPATRGEANASERALTGSAKETAETSTIEGTVTGWDGKPAVGMEIFLVAPDDPVPPRAKGGMWHVPDSPEDLKDLAQLEALLGGRPNAKTDENGYYAARGVLRGWTGVVVARVSPTYEVRSTAVQTTEAVHRVDLRLPPPATLRVRLVSAIGGPHRLHQLDVKGEFVWFSLQRADEDTPGFREDEDGSVVVAQATPGRVTVHAWIEAGPMVERPAELIAGEVTEVRVEVPVEGTVRGRVLYPAEWRLLHASLMWDGDRTVLGDVGADGEFRLAGTGRGRGRLTVHAFTHPGGHFDIEVEDIVPDSGLVEVRLERKAPSVVFGHVQGVEGPATLRGQLLSRKTSGGFQLDVGADGRFEAPFTSKEPALFVLEREGMAPVVVDLPVMAPGERRDAGVLRLGPGLEVAGIVRGSDGLPVKGVEVAIAERWAPEYRVKPTTTDEHGAFRITHLPARPVLLRFRGGGFPQHLVTVDPEQTPKPEIVLRPGGTANVRVVDADGKPVPGASLVILPAGDFPYDADFDSTRFHRDVDAEGRAQLRMCSGPRRLQAYAPKGRHASETAEITIREGETTEVTLTLREKPVK